MYLASQDKVKLVQRALERIIIQWQVRDIITIQEKMAIQTSLYRFQETSSTAD